VRTGRWYIEHPACLGSFSRVRFELRRAPGWAVLFLILSAALIGRHFLHAPLHQQLEGIMLSGDNLALRDAAEKYVSAERTHYVVWASFVTVWVILESCIVYNGWRGYRRLRALIAARSEQPLLVSARLLLLATGALASLLVPIGFAYGAELDPEAVRGVISGAYASNAAYRNALYLYLRLAGVVWITVEWIAAFVLWRSFRLISEAVRRAEAQA
jgi:hypothetical protein